MLSDIARAAIIVAALWLAASMAYSYGYSSGLRDAPEWIARDRARDIAESEAWARIIGAVGEDSTCQNIRDLVLEDLVPAESLPEAVSPHND